MEEIGEENSEDTQFSSRRRFRKQLIVIDKSDKVKANRPSQPLQEITESAEPKSFRKKIKDFYDKSEDPSFRYKRYSLELILECAAEMKSEKVNLKHITSFCDKTEKINSAGRSFSSLEEVNEETMQQDQFRKETKPFYDKKEGLPMSQSLNTFSNLEQICEERDENKIPEFQINKGGLIFCDKTEKVVKKIKSFEYLQKIEETPEND